MCPTVELETVEDVPADSRVCHYDELDDAAKEELPTLTDDDRAVADAAADGLRKCDLVKFTDYYAVDVE